MSTTRITKQNKPKVFLFFLFFATLLWILTKFSKQYLSGVDVYMEYKNLPENTLLSDAPKSISVDLTANGFEFIYFRLKRPKVELNLNKYYSEESKGIEISREALQMEISKNIDREVVLSDASRKSIDVQLDRIANKEVAIVVDADLRLQKGFRLVDSVQVSPSRVILSAPSQVLDSIDYVYTVKWEAKNINKSQNKKLKLKVPNYEKTFLDLEEVTATIDVMEYTQKNLQIPITVINKPNHITLMLIPEVLTLTTDVDIEEYNSIAEGDFKVICDYNKRNEEDGVLHAEISETPNQAFNTKLSETTIDYLIFK